MTLCVYPQTNFSENSAEVEFEHFVKSDAQNPSLAQPALMGGRFGTPSISQDAQRKSHPEISIPQHFQTLNRDGGVIRPDPGALSGCADEAKPLRESAIQAASPTPQGEEEAGPSSDLQPEGGVATRPPRARQQVVSVHNMAVNITRQKDV